MDDLFEIFETRYQINYLRRLRAARNFSQVSLLLLLVLAAERRRSLCSLSFAMAGSLSHVAGGRGPSFILMVHAYRYIL